MNNELGNNAGVTFLGRVTQEQPELLDRLSDRSRYILFAHSDQRNKKTYSEIGEIFGVTRQRVEAIYKRDLTKTFNSSNPDIQKATPLETILEDNFATISDATRVRLGGVHKGKKRSSEIRDRMAEQIRTRFSDPDFIEYMRRLQDAKNESKRTR